MAKAAITDPTQLYFSAINAALEGLSLFMREERAGVEDHALIAEAVSATIAKLQQSLNAFSNKQAFSPGLRIAQGDSGFPAFQHILELTADKAKAEMRLGQLANADTLRAEMADYILRRKAFPNELRADLAERLYLESVKGGDFMGALDLPETIRLSTNPKTMRPSYVARWAAYDGVANLPMVFLATIEDSTDNVMRELVRKDGSLNERAGVRLPVAGLLNPDLARAFDAFAEKNASYSLSPITVAMNLDKDFPTLHPKRLKRIVLGPFWTAGITRNNQTVSEILSRIKKQENAWLISWTVQDVYSVREVEGKKGFFSAEPSRQEFHIDTADLEATQMGVSSYIKHALVPHEAYQALYASGEARKIFDGFKVHIIAKNTVVSDA
ncbi:MAG: hypothetical protein ACRCT6_09225 [Notoacmeibacter sp.]